MDFDDDMNLVTCGPNQEQASTQEKIGQELYTLPQGFPFVRTDEEVITHYLKKKINHESVPYICTVNIYDFNPQELAETYPSLVEDEWYFFTPRARNYQHGNLPNRAAGNGYWKATGAEKLIYQNNVCIGSKKSLVFYEGKDPNVKKSDWIMHEYVDYQSSGQQQDSDAMLLDSCVLCQIHMNSSQFAKSKKRAFASSSCQFGHQETDKSFENEKEAQECRSVGFRRKFILINKFVKQKQTPPAATR
ncbi:NAC domain-containing protein 1-like [Primulina huaijiensis]|uniref:NAC domain-containing protein 1-like n=1 Tax=Primulina huaijiensis TaxID=1492673 RepID=UPI003CC770C9